jgi:hypothetical protein
MKTKRPWWAGSTRSLFFFAVLAIAPGGALAQGDLSEGPPNSHAKPYGSGWECDRGYEKLGESCVVIQIPSNAFLGTFGDEWECDRGYRKVNEGCAAVQVPPNALLDYSILRRDPAPSRCFSGLFL